MRVLWIASNGGKYKQNIIKGTGSWIGALQDVIIGAIPDLELGIMFPHSTDDTPMKIEGVTYIPTHYSFGNNLIEKFYNHRFRNIDKYNRKVVLRMAMKAKEFQPDVIHIWGLENFYSGVLEHIHDIPTVVHIQGFASAVMNAYIPPSYSIRDVCNSDSIMFRILNYGNWFAYKTFEKRVANELRLAPYVKYWIGRTNWDRSIAKTLSPKSHYFHCDEMLRSEFFKDKWQYHYNGEVLNIQSVISMDWYKGMDVVLKTANILRLKGVKICWNIFGWSRNSSILGTFIKRTGIVPENVGVVLRGKVDGKTIKNALLKSDVYVHPSYIENSCNAIAEAQLVGTPVIAQYVGGNLTMLKNNSGVLVAPNEPYILASKILSMCDRSIAESYSRHAIDVATNRHNITNVINDLKNVYLTLHEA